MTMTLLSRTAAYVGILTGLLALALSIGLAAPAHSQSPEFESGVDAQSCFVAYASAHRIANSTHATNRIFRLRQMMAGDPEAPVDAEPVADLALVSTIHACERSLASSGSPFRDFTYLLWRTQGQDGGPSPSNFRCAATYMAHAEIANRPVSASRSELPSLLALAQQAFQARLAELGSEEPQLVEQAIMREAVAILDRRGLLPDEEAQAEFMRPRTECNHRFLPQAAPE